MISKHKRRKPHCDASLQYANVDDVTPKETTKWQVEVLSHSPAASTEFSTMSFPMNKINETEGRGMLVDTVSHAGSEAMALMT